MPNSTNGTQELPTSTVEDDGDIIGVEFTRLCQIVIFGVICQSIVIFGTITNIINIICFVKQGFKDAINVSFFGLAISDLGCVATLIFSNLCVSVLNDLDLSFDPIDVGYLVTSWPHVIFSRITGWITVVITLERCLCVTMPLKIKAILTPGRLSLTILAIYVVLTGCGSSFYFGNQLGWTYSVLRNKTILGLVATPDRDKIDTVTFALNNMFLPNMAFLFVTLSTCILVVSMKRKSEWRKTSTFVEQAKAMSVRDQKVARMVVCISALFIACFFPLSVATMVMVSVPGLSIDGQHQDILIAIVGGGIVLESANSASNIFIYYKMSSKYRAVFHQIFRLRRQSDIQSEKFIKD